MKKKKQRVEEEDDFVRIPSTKGWRESSDKSEALPIKVGKQVIKTFRENRVTSENADGDASSGEEDPQDGPHSVDDEQSMLENDSQDSDEQLIDDDNDDNDDEQEDGPEEGSSYLPKDKNAKDEKLKQAMPTKAALVQAKTPILAVRSFIARVCIRITSVPRLALRRRTTTEERELATKGRSLSAGGPDEDLRMADLFEIMRSDRSDCAELAVLSALVVFKSIAPGYRIKAAAPADVHVKKETKKQQDYERALVHAYQQYLHLLERLIRDGLGSVKSTVLKWTQGSSMGIKALRCECELLRALPHFNFRSSLIKAIVTRAAQPCRAVAELCQDTLKRVFEEDITGEVTYETVRLMGTYIKEVNHKVEPRYIACMQSMKLHTRMDQGSAARKDIKKSRRRKRRQEDGVDAGLEESSSAEAVARYRRKFQADALQEASLIYFRIIKRKVGTALIPVALEGLGQITHLVNIDTVEDLVVVLKELVDSPTLRNPAEAHVRVRCLLCALRTLAGPGRELTFDPHVFIESTRDTLCDLPCSFNEWPAVLECVQLALMGRTEVSRGTVETVVLLLLSHATQCHGLLAATMVALAHKVLVRYPRLRLDQQVFRMGAGLGEDEDEVGDMAMSVFRQQSDGAVSALPPGMDGTWTLPLLLRQRHGPLMKQVRILATRDVQPLLLQLTDAGPVGALETADAAMKAFGALPAKLEPKTADKPMQTGQQSERLSKKQRNKLKKLAKDKTKASAAV